MFRMVVDANRTHTEPQIDPKYARATFYSGAYYLSIDDISVLWWYAR